MSNNSSKFNNKNILIQQILNKISIRGSDAAVKNESIAEKQIITITYNKRVNEVEITLASQKYNMVPAAKALTLLKLIYFIY